MAQRGIAMWVSTEAWQGSARKTGDADNITAYIYKDGGDFVASENAVSEIMFPGSVASGRYHVLITANESLANARRIAFRSSTSGVLLPDYSIVTDTIQGVNKVTITIKESNLTPIPGVYVYIYDSNETVVYVSGVTNTSGVVEFYLDSGTYKIICMKAFASFANPITLNVDGNEFVSITGTINIPSSSVNGVQTIYDWARNGAGTAIQNAIVRAIPKDNANGDIGVLTDFPSSTTSAANGYWSLPVVKGAEYRVEIESRTVNTQVELTVSSSNTERLRNYLKGIV